MTIIVHPDKMTNQQEDDFLDMFGISIGDFIKYTNMIRRNALDEAQAMIDEILKAKEND